MEDEKRVSDFLSEIGIDYIVWPYNWKNPALGTNRAVLDERKVKIIAVHQVELDTKDKWIKGSEKEITNQVLPTL